MLWRKTSPTRCSEEVLGRLFKLRRNTSLLGSIERLSKLRRTGLMPFSLPRRLRPSTERWLRVRGISEELLTMIREGQLIKNTTITQGRFLEILGSQTSKDKRRCARCRNLLWKAKEALRSRLGSTT